jgi:hypothetical protein
MSNKIFFILLTLVLIISGCGVEASKTSVETLKTQADVIQNSPSGPTIEIEPNSPADTVRAFYKNLREKKIREAVFLTNLRSAVEGLTDAEMKDLQVDFDALAERVPAEIQINGEIISGDKATVTAKLPDEKTNKMKTQEIKLKRENDVWILKMVGDEAEKQVKKEGNNYFFALRIETHHEEAKDMMERIMKAEMICALQNQGAYADLPTLVSKGLLPGELLQPDVAGYNYKVVLSADKKNYSATAEPTVYGKSGKLSFLGEVSGGKDTPVKSADNGGRTLKMQ